MAKFAFLMLLTALTSCASKGGNPQLLANPGHPKMNEQAPASFKVEFKTSTGEFVVEVTRDLSPHGADRFYNLVKNGFYDDTAYFRAAYAPFWHLGRNPTVDIAVFRESQSCPNEVEGQRATAELERPRGPSTSLGELDVLLIRRHPDAPAEPNQWALPGGFVPTAAPRGTVWTPGVETE